jgi:hypothetical protein
MSLTIIEVDNATPLAGGLFWQTFGHAIPEFPRHFVAFYHAPETPPRVVAYIHYTPWEHLGWLCGGLCVDPNAYASAGAEEALTWKRAGGIGEILLRDTLARLVDRPAIFGYCGSALQWQHDLNVGFMPAGPKHLLVIWNRQVPPAEQEQMIQRIVALGPF